MDKQEEWINLLDQKPGLHDNNRVCDGLLQKAATRNSNLLVERPHDPHMSQQVGRGEMPPHKRHLLGLASAELGAQLPV